MTLPMNIKDSEFESEDWVCVCEEGDSDGGCV